ncbi:MAG: hypothetical protein H0T60_13200 [Acidobacteria bacterium]|nr:hypothetical protein [Acidobacteriota bacterium]
MPVAHRSVPLSTPPTPAAGDLERTDGTLAVAHNNSPPLPDAFRVRMRASFFLSTDSRR